MQEDVKTRVAGQVSKCNHVDNSPETMLRESALGGLFIRRARHEGYSTILLPIQGYHLNPLFPERGGVKIVASDPRETGIHSHQVSQIMFLHLMIGMIVLQ